MMQLTGTMEIMQQCLGLKRCNNMIYLIYIMTLIIQDSNDFLKPKLFKKEKLRLRFEEEDIEISGDEIRDLIIELHIIHLEGIGFGNFVMSSIQENYTLTEQLIGTDYSYNIALHKLGLFM
jgi:hypothetical protein